MNSFGQLGDGTNFDRRIPTQVVGEHRFAQIVAGEFFTCGRKSSGEIYCWGAGGSLCGVSGLIPTLLSSILKFSHLAGDNYHTCAVSFSGRAYCWGNNGY